MESCAEAAGPMDENPPPLGGGVRSRRHREIRASWVQSAPPPTGPCHVCGPCGNHCLFYFLPSTF